MLVTQSTLLQFHRSHFRGQPLPSLTHPTQGFASADGLHEIKNIERIDNVLGHYADGFERTLTDEQIAIFRHTEIQELLKGRRQRAEALAGSAVGLDHIGSGRSSQDPSPESENLSLPSLPVDEDAEYETKEEERPCDNAKTHYECLNRVSKLYNPTVNHVWQDLGQALSAEQSTNVNINPAARKVIRYEEDDIVPTPRTNEAVRSNFLWPELRDQ